MRNMFMMYTGVAAIALIASGFMKQYHMSSEHTETKTGVDQMTERKTKEEISRDTDKQNIDHDSGMALRSLISEQQFEAKSSHIGS